MHARHVVAGRREGKVPAHRVRRLPLLHHVAVVQHVGLRAEPHHRVGVMAHEQHRHPIVLHPAQLCHATRHEPRVADRQRFVDDEYLRIDVDRGGEREAHQHARRIRLHRHLEEVADVGKRQDAVVALCDLGIAQAEDPRVEEHVLAPRELRVESGPEFEQGRQPPSDYYLSLRRRQRTGYDL